MPNLLKKKESQQERYGLLLKSFFPLHSILSLFSMDIEEEEPRCTTMVLIPSKDEEEESDIHLKQKLRFSNDGDNEISKMNEKKMKVYIRIRLISEDEKKNGITSDMSTIQMHDDNTIQELPPSLSHYVGRNLENIIEFFSFDKVLPPLTSQQEVFDSSMSPLVNKMCEGYSSVLFA